MTASSNGEVRNGSFTLICLPVLSGGMALAVKDDKASNPVAISLLGPDAVVLDSVPVADAVAQQDRWNRPPSNSAFRPPNCIPEP